MLNAFSVKISALIDDTATQNVIDGVDATFISLGYKVIKQDGHTIVIHHLTKHIYVSQAGWNYLQEKYADPDQKKVDAFTFQLHTKITQ